MDHDRELRMLLTHLDPVIAEAEVVVVEVGHEPSFHERLGAAGLLGMVREGATTTMVMRRADADLAGHRYEAVFAWISLRVESSLEAVGLTAAFSTALATRGIACNVLAGARHDHLLVPVGRADEAIEVLRQLADQG